MASSAGFEVFYRREYSAAVALAFALYERGGAAEDLAQEALVAAQQRSAKVGRYDRPDAYVRHVVVNTAVSYVHRWATEGRALVRLAGRTRPWINDREPNDAAFSRTVRSFPARKTQVALFNLEDRSASTQGTDGFGSDAEVGEGHGQQTLLDWATCRYHSR
jgi:DNA-directed RNA polymerase specialized sigma24 family protein